MPFKTTPEIDYSSVGLITDIPAHSLPDGAWNDCLNMRCKDGSVQGVNAFIDDIELHDTDENIKQGRALAITQFTPAGSDFLIIAYIVEGVDGFGHVVTYNTSTKVWNDITNSTTSLKFTFDERFPPQIFVFNELLIVNPAFDAPPMFTDASISSGSLNIMPNWPSDSTPSPLVTRSLKPFSNRLMAMNILEEHTTSTADDVNLPVDILWSSHITGIGSLTSAEWTASTTNTAGDAFAVDTPGKILDGGQLGEFFIAYKSDAVIRVAETGDTYVLSFESIFEDDGIYSTRCFANIGDAQHLVVGNYGVYIHDGQSQKTDIAKNIFKTTAYALVKTGGCIETSYDTTVIPGVDNSFPLTLGSLAGADEDTTQIVSDPLNPGRFLLYWEKDTTSSGFNDKFYVQVMNIVDYTVTLGAVLELTYQARSNLMFDPKDSSRVIYMNRPSNISIQYLTISGNTLSLGANSSSTNGNLPYGGMLQLLTNDEFVITYVRTGGSNSYVGAQGGTRDSAGAVSWGTSISLGSPTVNASDSSSSAILNTNKVLLAYRRPSNLALSVLTVSNGVVTIGTEASLPLSVLNLGPVATTSGNRFLITTTSFSYELSLVVGTILGTTVTFVNTYADIAKEVVWSNVNTSIRFHPNNPDKFDLVYSNGLKYRTIRGTIESYMAVGLYEPLEQSPHTGIMSFVFPGREYLEAIALYSGTGEFKLSLIRTTVNKTVKSCEVGAQAPSERDRAFCFQQSRDKEVWFCFPSAGYDGLGCDTAFVYDYNEKKLHKRSLPGVSDIYETEVMGNLKIYAAKPNSNKLQALSEDIYEADGFFVHEDDNLTDNTTIKWINGIYLDSVNNVKVGLSATQQLNDTKTYTMQTFTPATAYKLDVRTTGRYMNLKVQMDGSTNPQLGKLQFDIKLAGKR
jgi:hypothetical protein